MSQMPRKRFQEDPEEPPVAAMSRLMLRRTPTVTSNTHQTQPPTWGQIKKLSEMVEEHLRKTGQPVTTSNLMIAMIAVITIAPADADPDSCEK
nr:endogenous retrovirus group K member 19 Rec protein [Macaca nemestrina]